MRDGVVRMHVTRGGSNPRDDSQSNGSEPRITRREFFGQLLGVPTEIPDHISRTPFSPLAEA